MTTPLPLFVPPTAHQAHLRIIATTDLHMHVLPYDYYADRAAPSHGLAVMADLVASLRAGAPASLLLDNGDFLQGNPMGDVIAEQRHPGPGRPHPMIAAMNALGYDAAGLGNHEFNYGLDFLRDSLAAAAFPVVCANVGLPGSAAGTLRARYVILDRQLADAAGRLQTLRIGVLGVLPPQIMVWDRAHLHGRVITHDIVAAAAACLPRIRAEGADLVVALCHSGIGPAIPEPGMENAATALAALPGIDAVVAGHSHLVFPGAGFAGLPGVDPVRGTLAGKPAVMAGCFGSHLGLIDLLLDRAGDGWHVAAATAAALPVPRNAATGPAGAAIRAAVAADHAATLAHIRRPVGRTEVPLTSFFAMLPGNAALAVVAEAQRWHVAQALRGTAHADIPLLSAVAPFKMGGRGGPDYYTDVPAGDLALRNVADLYAYPNTIRAVLVTGAGLAAWLERAAGIFATLAPARPDQPLLDPDTPYSHFDVIDGVTYTIDLARPPRGAAADGSRIGALRYDGRPVAATDRFIIATNSYRAVGGASHPGTPADSVIYESAAPIRDILRRYVLRTGTIRAHPGPGWRFRPLQGATALFLSAPRAAAHLGTLPGLRVDLVGPAPGGFATFRLHL